MHVHDGPEQSIENVADMTAEGRACMGILVDITGLSVNVMTDKELLGLMKLYLGNDYMNIIYMFSVDTCKKIADNEELSMLMNDADLRLPAEKIILNKKYRHTYRGISKSYMSFLYMLRCRGLVNHLYVIGKNTKLTEMLVKVFENQNENINICGSHAIDLEESKESVVNDINSHAPDIIVVALDTPDVQEWVENNRQMLNARLCVCLCDISETVVKENVEPPKWIQTLLLGRLYNYIIRRKYTESRKKERIFQTLLTEYKDKKE